MDILVFGGIAFLLYKLFAARKGAAQRPAYNRTANNYEEPQPVQSNPAGFNTMFYSIKIKSLSWPKFSTRYDFNNTVAVPAGLTNRPFYRALK